MLITINQSGTEVSMHFDSMLCKIIVHDADRRSAINKMIFVLKNTVCLGVISNQKFLQSILQHPSFHIDSYSTSLISDNLQELLSIDSLTSQLILQVLPCAATLFLRDQRFKSRQSSTFGSISPRWRNVRSDKASARQIDYLEIKSTLLGGGAKGVFVQYGNERTRNESTYSLSVCPEPAEVKNDPQSELLYYNKAGGHLVQRYYRIFQQQEKNAQSHKADLVSLCDCTYRLELDGRQHPFYVVSVGEDAYIHSPEIGTGIRISRQDLLTYSGLFHKRVSGQTASTGKSANFTCLLHQANTDR